jgi:hypothetical protein
MLVWTKWEISGKKVGNQREIGAMVAELGRDTNATKAPRRRDNSATNRAKIA